MKKSVMILMMGVAFSGVDINEAAGFDVFPICTASGDQTRPDISGNTAVWIREQKNKTARMT